MFSDKAIIFVNGEFLGGPSEFLKWAEQEYNYENFRPSALYQTLAEEAYKNHLNTQQVIQSKIDGKAIAMSLAARYITILGAVTC